MKVTIVSPGYSSKPGGVTAHTARLIGNWTRLGASVQVVENCESVVHALKEIKGFGSTAVLIHYVPFLYGRRGVSRFPKLLVKGLHKIGIETTLFVHEPGVPPTRLPWIPLSIAHKFQLRTLCNHLDHVVTPVPAWLPLLPPGATVFPVGSTLGEPEEPFTTGAALEAPVVFSPFAAGLQWEWIADAVAAIDSDPGLIILGAERETFRNHPQTSPFYDSEWDFKGYLPGDEVLSLLSRARCVLAPYVDGLTSRRTSAMATLATGTRLITCKGHLFDPAFDIPHISPVNNRSEFATMAATIWTEEENDKERTQRFHWFRDELDSTALDEKLLALMNSGA